MKFCYGGLLSIQIAGIETFSSVTSFHPSSIISTSLILQLPLPSTILSFSPITHQHPSLLTNHSSTPFSPHQSLINTLLTNLPTVPSFSLPSTLTHPYPPFPPPLTHSHPLSHPKASSLSLPSGGPS